MSIHQRLRIAAVIYYAPVTLGGRIMRCTPSTPSVRPSVLPLSLTRERKVSKFSRVRFDLSFEVTRQWTGRAQTRSVPRRLK